ncbi:hypothetical protein ACP275_05G136000 [Erythranthe tilingii]
MIFVPEKNGFRNFISLYRNKVYKLEIPAVRGRKTWGSCSGWILTLGLDLTIQLLNPLTRVCLSLPPQSSLQLRPNDARTPYCYRVIKRVFVFMKQQPPPRNDEGDSFVVIIYGPLYQLAVYRPGYTSWTIVKETATLNQFIGVAFRKDRIFALCKAGSLSVFDIDSLAAIDFDDPTPPENVKFALRKGKFNHLMLVESRGDILIVCKQQDSNRCGFPVGPVHFFVYTLDFINKQWVEVRDLGNRAIFVDKSGCVVVCGPERFNCRSNSVYFVADDMKRWLVGEVWIDLCVYNLADRVSEALGFSSEIPNDVLLPLWIVPTLE